MATKNIFSKHPRATGMTYWQHFRGAFMFGAGCISAGCMAIIHSLLPFFFEHGAGNKVKKLHQRLLDVQSQDALD